MKKILYPLFFIQMLAFPGLAQQKPQMSQYMLNNYLTNPAISGIEDYSDVKLGFRKQWVGFQDSPKTMYLSFHTALNKADLGSRKTFRVKNGAVIEQTKPGSNKKSLYKARPHHGFGGVLLSDQSGAINTTGLSGSYAYHVPLTKKIKISGGLSGGFLKYSLDQNKMNLLDAGDPYFNEGKINSVMFDLNAGVWLYSQQFYAGISTSQLVANKRDLFQSTRFTGESRLQKHYYATGGIKLDVTPKFSLIPSTFIKFAYPSPLAIDLNVKALYDDRYFVGVSYRKEDALAVIAGINVGSAFDFGYSYDANTSNLRSFNSGSHELVLGIKLFNRRKIICPEWLW